MYYNYTFFLLNIIIHFFPYIIVIHFSIYYKHTFFLNLQRNSPSFPVSTAAPSSGVLTVGSAPPLAPAKAAPRIVYTLGRANAKPEASHVSFRAVPPFPYYSKD